MMVSSAADRLMITSCVLGVEYFVGLHIFV